jgi:hypothetical protein
LSTNVSSNPNNEDQTPIHDGALNAADGQTPGQLPPSLERPQLSEAIPLSTEGTLHNIPIFLGARERATAEELARLDTDLARLYRFGHELVARANEPGIVYVLAHIGRELSRGVVRRLVGEEFQIFDRDSDDVPENERNRLMIGAMLQLAPNHASVTSWFRLNRTFAETCHYRSPGSSGEEVRAAFLQFSELIYGRVAPYFATYAELDQLLARFRCKTLWTEHERA